MPRQEELFQEAARLPSGFVYQPRFVTEAEERELLGGIATLDLRQAQYKELTAHRRVASFGAGYDFDANELTPARELRYSITFRTRREEER